jgi:hypothetical protein
MSDRQYGTIQGRVSRGERRLTFGIGDIVFDPYYNVCGEIVCIKENPNNKHDKGIHATPFFIIRDDKGNETAASLKYVVADSPLPLYLQLVCKASDVPGLAMRLGKQRFGRK